jgi:hypothetical protein
MPTDDEALQELAEAGIGEGDFGESHVVPADLLELHEVLEYEEALRAKAVQEATEEADG